MRTQNNDSNLIVMGKKTSQILIETRLVVSCQREQIGKPASNARCKQLREYPKRVLNKARTTGTNYNSFRSELHTSTLWDDFRSFVAIL